MQTFTHRDGLPDQTTLIASRVWGSDNVIIETTGTTHDADTMLAGRVMVWNRRGVSYAAGLIYDSSRYLVSCTEPLPRVAADALELEGFANVAAFRAAS